MALFSRKQNKKTEAKQEVASQPVSRMHDLSWVLVKPRITEKATDMNAVRAYVFLVSEKANKRSVARAVSEMYKVNPVRVRITRIPRKMIRNARNGKLGMKGGGKKAYVYLKEGDSINLV